MALLPLGFSTCQVLLGVLVAAAAAAATELVPERFLRPRDFNHHPFTDVGVPAALKPSPRLPLSHPYAILATKRPREGRQFPHQDVIIYPSPHPSVLPRKHIDTETNEVNEVANDVVNEVVNEVGYESDPYAHVPKNYAFSYSVKDQQSGDDFSHSQAHNGKATRGQYRVKLPDGRVQVVSYTADHKGYRADVQYEDDPTAVKSTKLHRVLFRPENGPETPAALPQHSPNTLFDTYEAQQQRAAQVAPVQFPRVPENPPEQEQPAPAPSPVYQARHNYQFVPRYVEQDYYHPTTPAPEEDYIHNTVSPSPGPLRIVLAQNPTEDYYVRDKYVSTTAAPYQEDRFVSEPYRPQFETSSPADHGYLHESSTLAPEATHQVLVTPRTLFRPAHEPKQRPLLIRIVKK